MSDRLLTFEAIDNFRDFGGYAGANGKVTRGRLFRSGQLSRATSSDLVQLQGLNLQCVIDLRRASERAKQPDRMPQDWQGQTLSSDLGGEGLAPHIQFLKGGKLTENSGRNYMAGTYGRMPFEPSHVALFKGYFGALLSDEGASLIHCAAGKDRTGLLASLVHRALGVHEDDVMADYLATNTAVNLEGRAEEMGQWLGKMTGHPVSRDAVVAFLGVDADFLHHAYRAIEAQSGTLDTYLEQVLELDDAAIGKLRQVLSA